VNQEAAQPEAPAEMSMRQCPFCSEKILATARKCKHCGEIIDPELKESRKPAATERLRRDALPDEDDDDDDERNEPASLSGSGYVHSNLTLGEKVIYQAHLHWIVFVSLRAILTLWIAPLIDWFSSEFAVTNKRIIIKVGLISRKTLEMNLAKVESVNVNQGIFGRILGYGCVTVIGTGGTREPFHGISHPTQFRKAFQAAL
jgi:hypothetical protein